MAAMPIIATSITNADAQKAGAAQVAQSAYPGEGYSEEVKSQEAGGVTTVSMRAKESANKNRLKAAIAKAEAIAKDGKTYAAHSRQVLDNALAQATMVRDGKSYTQSQVDWQVRVLDAIVGGMDVQNKNAKRYDTVQVGRTWLDTDGSAIQAHGGGFLQQTDTDGKPIYYWVGEDKTHNSSNFNGISLYSSKDLVNWTFRNVILKADVNTPGLADNKIERPKLVYNAKTHKYVLWGHWEASDGYTSSQVAVATSDTVDGNYTFLGHWRPGADAQHRNWRFENGRAFFDGTGKRIDDYSDANVWGTGSRDLTVFVDDDGTAYLLSAQDGSRMRIYRLNDDYTDVAFNADGRPAMTYLMFDGGGREAPALSKVGGRYYLITSGQSGWYPNAGRYSYTTNLSDPKGWKLDADGKNPFARIGNNSTFYSQPTNIMQIKGSAGTTLVYMGDRWTPSALRESTYVWLPLTQTGNASNPLSMSYADGWSLDTATGKVRLPDVRLLSRGKDVRASTDAAVSNKDGFKLGYANDGDYSTAFRGFRQDGSTVAMPFTYTVDLGKAYRLERTDLSTNLVNGSETYYQYTIETSVDGKTWTKRVDQSRNILVGFKSDALNDIEARYVRLNVARVLDSVHNNHPADWTTGIQEFEVYGANVDSTATDDPDGSKGSTGAEAPSAPSIRFTDVTSATPHARDIQWLAAAGISTGWPTGGTGNGSAGKETTAVFSPMGPVIRQDMAAFLYRLAGSPAYTPSAEDKAKFSDVNERTPHHKEIWWLAHEGIAAGFRNADGTYSFGGGRTVVRQDMAAFLKRLADRRGAKPALADGKAFSDVTDATPHVAEVRWLSRAGIAAGYADGTFGPMRTVVRQDMAAFLHRMHDNVLNPAK